MNPYDKENARLQLEALKLSQASLQQMMTLSAGGLALFFSFIAKAPFLTSLRILSILVVISWIVSLSAAVIAHLIHSHLFRAFHSLSKLTDAMDSAVQELDVTYGKVRNANATAEQKAAVESGKKRWDEQKTIYAENMPRFQRSVLGMQKRIGLFTGTALLSLLCGFLLLVIAYILSVR